MSILTVKINIVLFDCTLLVVFRLQERAGNVRRSLRDLDLIEDRFYELKSVSEEDISLRDYVAVSYGKKNRTELIKLGSRTRLVAQVTADPKLQVRIPALLSNCCGD